MAELMDECKYLYILETMDHNSSHGHSCNLGNAVLDWRGVSLTEIRGILDWILFSFVTGKKGMLN